MPVSSPKKKAAAAKGAGAKASSTTSKAKTSSSSKGEGTTAGDASLSHTRRPSLVDPIPSADFEAGLLFERFGAPNAGKLDALTFQRMWRERDQLQQLRKSISIPATTYAVLPPQQQQQQPVLPSSTSIIPPPPSSATTSLDLSAFEAGQFFERYDNDHDGRLSRTEFEHLLTEYLRSKTLQAQQQQFHHSHTPPPAPSPPVSLHPPPPPPPASSSSSMMTTTALQPQHLPNVTHYNETMGIPLPSEAIYRYTSGYGHTVIPITEAYEKRMHKLQALMSSKLLPHREQLVQLGRRITAIEDEVKSAKTSIERETLADCHAILERLRSAEALKTAGLSHRMNEVVAEFEAINKLVNRIDPVNKEEKGGNYHHLGGDGSNSSTNGRQKTLSEMLDIIQSFPELCASVEKATSKSLRPEVDVNADDFRRETAERLEILRRCDRYEQALEVKDQMVWNLMQERARLNGLNGAEEELRKEYTTEMMEWIELTNRLSDEVTKLKLEVAGSHDSKAENEKLRRENEALTALLTKGPSIRNNVTAASPCVMLNNANVSNAVGGGGGGGGGVIEGVTGEVLKGSAASQQQQGITVL